LGASHLLPWCHLCHHLKCYLCQPWLNSPGHPCPCPLLQTIPFLSELLEDTEIAVEARAQDVLKAMEEISGEKLDQYLKT
jgi:hypothetical protein